jgi:hypothetical protein
VNVVLTLPTSRSHRLVNARVRCAELRDEMFEACCELQRNPEKVDLQRLMRVVRELQMAQEESRDLEEMQDASTQLK